MGMFLLALNACQKDEGCRQADSINGEWIWIASVGGLAGQTHTPQSDGVTRKLEIDDFFFRQYVDDSLVFEKQYDLEIRKDSLFGTDQYLIFSDGLESAIKIKEPFLEIIELCFDCYVHEYRRKQ